MTRAQVQLALASLAVATLVAGCSKSAGRGGAGVGQACSQDNDCARGLSCAGGACVLPAGAAVCTAGARFCDGSNVVQCDATGQGSGFVENCPSGCASGACVDPACTLGARRCASDGVEQCALDASGTQGWQLVEPCPAGCDPSTDSCVALACNPLAVRCSPTDPSTVQTCAANGSSWSDAACATGQVCVNGACVVPGCTIGATECGPAGVEVCTAIPGSPPAWQLVEACPLGCDASVQPPTCVQLACKPLDVRCSPTAPNTVQSCASDDSGWVNASTCLAGTFCNDGSCAAQACTPGASSCQGSTLVVCNAQGSGPASSTTCAQGCSAGACVQASCTPGSTQCQAGAVQTCASDGSGFTQTQVCGGNSCVVISPGVAACGVPVCTPLARRCGPDGVSVQVCLGDGSGWSATTACAPGASCSDGVCGPAPTACTNGSLQCAGSSVQQCQAGSWVTTGACFGGCGAGGSCSGGSCSGQVPVAIPLPACASSSCAPPADGVSTLLAVAGPLVDSAGATLPDGTLVTVAATGGAVVTAADADPTTPGIQVRSLSGYADFAFRAPPASALSSGSAQVTVSAEVGDSLSCAGSASVTFAAAGSYVYAAEDFTSDLLRDLASSTADWRTDLGAAQSTALLFGTGSDGPLSLSAGATWDLAQTPRGAGLPPFAPSVQVLGLDTQSAQVQGSVAGFSAGDEVLLIELQGASLTSTSAAGSWELLTVASASDGQLSFTAPITGTYGSGPGAPLAGEKVAIQRIPQFTNVTIPAGATLTASAWDGTQGGIVAFRASGNVTVSGSISADAIGYRAGIPSGATINQAGESYGGQPAPSAAAPSRNAGAGGGGYLLCDPAHLDQLDSWYGAGGSYGTAGFAGSSDGTPSAAVAAGRAACLPAQGLPYGSPTLARLFPGSGSGSQSYNSEGPCNTNTCPGESRGPGYVANNPSILDYPVAFQSASTLCGGRFFPACAASFSYCAAETASYGSAYQTGGASSCNTTLNPSCAATFNQCGTLAANFGGSSLTLNHNAYNYALDVGCTTCSDTNSYCSADTKTYAQAWDANGASTCETSTNANCAQTFSVCTAAATAGYGANQRAFGASTCLTGNTCSSTFSAGNCSDFTTNHPSAVRPCGSNQTCLATFAACGANNNPSNSTSACTALCGTGTNNYYTANSCSLCGGCSNWNGRYCVPGSSGCGAPSACSQSTVESGVNTGQNPFYCSDCNSDSYAASSLGCGGFPYVDCCCDYYDLYCYDGNFDGRCPSDGNSACNSCYTCQGAAGTTCATNPAGAGCDAYCQSSGGCETNPGCTHNPGCAVNPGCETNVGCKTNTGCDTCGGRTSWDGAFCDFTNPNNTCLCPKPWQDDTQGGRGGGILFLAAASLDLSGGGVVSARGGAPGANGKPGFAGGAGGSLWVRVGNLKLAASGVQFDASGAVNAGAGRVRFERASGDDAVALGRVSPAPYAPTFLLPRVQSLTLQAPVCKTNVLAQLIPLSSSATTTLVEGTPPLVSHFLAADGATFSPVTAGAAPITLTCPASGTADLRFRAVFAPQPGPIARSAALVWLFQLQ